MKSKAVLSFWEAYYKLPTDIRKLAIKQFRLWLENPNHPSVRFKKVGAYWSARINNDYRAVGIMDGEVVIWFFIGTHKEYERLLK